MGAKFGHRQVCAVELQEPFHRLLERLKEEQVNGGSGGGSNH